MHKLLNLLLITTPTGVHSNTFLAEKLPYNTMQFPNLREIEQQGLGGWVEE